MSITQGITQGIRQGILQGIDPGAAIAPTATVLTEAGSTTDGTSIPTASVTPLANQVVYAAVSAFSAVSLIDPTCSGNGLTWVLVAKIAYDVNRQLSVFRSQGASPSAGAITFDFGAILQTSFRWSVIQYAGADTSGTNGSGATPQFATANSAAANNLTVTLPGALASAASRMLVFTSTSSTIITSDAQFTRLTEGTIGANTHRLESEHAQAETACSITCSSQAIGMVALEVKAA